MPSAITPAHHMLSISSMVCAICAPVLDGSDLARLALIEEQAINLRIARSGGPAVQ